MSDPTILDPPKGPDSFTREQGVDAVDEITQKRMDAEEWDYWIDLNIRGARLGNSGKVRWHITQDGDEVYSEQYVADVLEKVIKVIRENDAVQEEE